MKCSGRHLLPVQRHIFCTKTKKSILTGEAEQTFLAADFHSAQCIHSWLVEEGQGGVVVEQESCEARKAVLVDEHSRVQSIKGGWSK